LAATGGCADSHRVSAQRKRAKRGDDHASMRTCRPLQDVTILNPESAVADGEDDDQSGGYGRQRWPASSCEKLPLPRHTTSLAQRPERAGPAPPVARGRWQGTPPPRPVKESRGPPLATLGARPSHIVRLLCSLPSPV
jgi:hypothetical protein